jgi:hypothetical protein
MKNLWKRFWGWFGRTPAAQELAAETIAKELEPKEPKEPK